MTDDAVSCEQLNAEIAALRARLAQAEEAHREAERTLGSVSDYLWSAEIDAHDRWTYRFCSPVVERVTGRPPEFYLPGPERWLSTVHPEDRPRLEAALARVRGRQPRHEEHEYRILRPDGAVRWVRDSVNVEARDDGRVRLDGVVGDITPRREAEEALHAGQERLRQAQKLEAVARLAAGVAHDFNNLITVINGYGSLLLTALPAGAPARDLVKEVQKAGARAADLTQQLLALGGKQPVVPVALDLNALVRDAVRLLTPLLGDNIELITVLDPHLGRVRSDRSQLEQVILSLALDARDAMATGGRLVLQTRNAELEGRAGVAPGSYALLAVTDTGAGMDETTRAHVFEPFFAAAGRRGGTGLGLAAVHGIVKRLGGHIEVASRPGEGTTFQVYLPRLGEGAPAAPASTAGKETLLVVEDEDSVLGLARMVLESHGYTVLTARSGDAALTECRRHAGPIHLLVTDVVMPQMSGCELAERLVRDHPHLKLLFLSGFADETQLLHTLRRPGAAFLPKPFTPSLLARKVREMLDQAPEPALV